MRKTLISVAIAATPFLVSMEAMASSSGTAHFTVSSSATAVEDKSRAKKPNAFVSLILKTIADPSAGQQYYVLASASSDGVSEADSCPENQTKPAAAPEGAEEDQQKTAVGPEPLYFAF
ncbi:hypothetical protein [Hyphococcus sp.]|uniref:hypothetical protein n=1 Tax=Hyphococcus sp. TaxID=2038636 RepID=UPI003CCBD777